VENLRTLKENTRRESVRGKRGVRKKNAKRG
jgi:hypothetical protein